MRKETSRIEVEPFTLDLLYGIYAGLHLFLALNLKPVLGISITID